MEFRNRKCPRIPNYDYSKANYYFVTICTDGKKCNFADPMHLNPFGKVAEQCLCQIPVIFQGISVDKYVVMPNHVHAIIIIDDTSKKSASLTTVIGQYKSAVSRRIHEAAPGLKIWQRSFHDHIIRSEKQYEKIWNYIEGNPQCWNKDCFYIKEENH